MTTMLRNPRPEWTAEDQARALAQPGRQCERQVGARPETRYNAVTIPRAVFCPHTAEIGSPFCAEHDTAGES